MISYRDRAVGWNAEPDLALAAGLPSLDTDVTADVCVVGLGGSGLAAVGELLDRGLSVVGVDAGAVAAGAAGSNGGFLLGGPAHMAHHAAERWGADVAMDLYRQTLDEILALTDLLGTGVIRPTGSIRLAGLPGVPRNAAEETDRRAEHVDCERQFAFLRSYNIRVERYAGPLGTGLYLPDDAAMNPVRRAVCLAERYRGKARLYEHSPAIAIDSGMVATRRGAVSCAAVIVCVDGRLETVLPQLSGRVRTGRLQMLATDPMPDELLPCPTYCRWGYDYAQQDSSGRLFVGGGRDRFLDDEWTSDASPTLPVQRWIDDVATRIAGRRLTVRHRWGASVCYTQDGRALVTEVLPAVVACGGYSGTGNLVGPVAARAAVALALDHSTPAPYFAS